MIDTFIYRLLSRCKSDCLYFLGYGNRCEKHLYYGEVKKHIEQMKKIYLNLPEESRPEWLTLDDITNFEKQMQAN